MKRPLPSLALMHPQKQCPLFRLPAELRNQIFELVLSVSNNFRPGSDMQDLGGVVVMNRDCVCREGSHSVLALLQTCSRIFAEAECIFYSTNHILCSAEAGTKNKQRVEFLECIRHERLSVIQHLTITNVFYPRAAANVIKRLVFCAPDVKASRLMVWPEFARDGHGLNKLAFAISKAKHLKDFRLVLPYRYGLSLHHLLKNFEEKVLRAAQQYRQHRNS